MSVRAIFELFLNRIMNERAKSKNVHFNELSVFNVLLTALACLFKRKDVCQTPVRAKGHSSLLSLLLLLYYYYMKGYKRYTV